MAKSLAVTTDKLGSHMRVGNRVKPATRAAIPKLMPCAWQLWTGSSRNAGKRSKTFIRRKPGCSTLTESRLMRLRNWAIKSGECAGSDCASGRVNLSAFNSGHIKDAPCSPKAGNSLPAPCLDGLPGSALAPLSSINLTLVEPTSANPALCGR